VPIWGFIFALAALIVFLVEFVRTRSLMAAGFAALALGFILTFATTADPVHL